MEIIPLSAKGFAEFVLAGPSKKAQIVRNILKPKSTEAQVIVHYYARAIQIIRSYHSRNNDRQFLNDALRSLETKLAKAATSQSRASLRNNLRAIRGYIDVYGDRKRKIAPRPRIYYAYGRVRLSASPDLAIEEGKKLKLVKLGVRKDGDNPEVIRIMLRVIFQAARQRFQIEPRDVIYFDIANSARIRGSERDIDLATIIDNGCDALAEMA